MDTSSESNPGVPKRARTSTASEDNTAETSVTSNTTVLKAPKLLALAFINTHLETLLPNQHNILKTTSIQFLEILIKIYNKYRQIKKMETDAEYIPKSARVKFIFHMSKLAGASPEFKPISEETESILQDFRAKLKNQIIKATKVELLFLRRDLTTNFASSIRLVMQLLHTNEALQSFTADAMVDKLLATHHASLLLHCECGLDEFKTQYKATHQLGGNSTTDASTSSNTTAPTNNENAAGGLAVDVPVTALHATQAQLANTAAASSPFFQTIGERADAMQQQLIAARNIALHPTTLLNNAVTAFLTQTFDLVNILFFHSFDRYVKQCKSNEETLRTKKLFLDHFEEKKTEDTVLLLDSERALESGQIDELCAKKVRQQTQKISKELEKLKLELKSVKNSRRGPAASASTNKENAEQHKSHTQRHRQQKKSNASKSQKSKKNAQSKGKRKVDAAANDTNAAKPKKSKRNAKKQSKSKGNRGNNARKRN